MSLTCPNCNQTVLPTDTVCWHCGYRLSPQSAQRKVEAEPVKAVMPPEPFSLSAVIIYSITTVVIIIGLLWTMYNLGQRPLVLLNPDTNVNVGWIPVTDQALRFTLDMPPGWQAWHKQQPQQRDEFDNLLATHEQLEAAIMPWRDLLSDMDILLIVMGEQAEGAATLPGFVVVGESEALGRLSFAQMITLVDQDSDWAEIDEVNRFKSFVGDERLALSTQLPPVHLICQQHVIVNETTNYLLAGCAPDTRYSANREALEKILGSFQLLR